MVTSQLNPRQPPLRAVLWDLDGTLMDSQQNHWLAWQATMVAEGHLLTYDQFLASFGQRNDVVLRGFFGPRLTDDQVMRIADAKEARYRELLRGDGADLLPGVRQWLSRLGTEGWRQAIASSAPRANVDTALAVLGIGDCFEAIVAGEDVRHGKPDPEVFLLAASRLGVRTRQCVVVEDAPAGLEAARRAGMAAIGVCSIPGRLKGRNVVASLVDLSPDAFATVLAEHTCD